MMGCSAGHTKVAIREATPKDAARIAEIYNHYILNATCTFHTSAVSVQERRDWIESAEDGFARLVATQGDQVVGWGAVTPWASRPAWYPTVELSVYVDEASHGLGVGRKLMERLIASASDAGHHVAMGQIVSENAASIALAASLGFEEVGVLREVGEKFGRRLDVVLMELILD